MSAPRRCSDRPGIRDVSRKVADAAVPRGASRWGIPQGGIPVRRFPRLIWVVFGIPRR